MITSGNISRDSGVLRVRPSLSYRIYGAVLGAAGLAIASVVFIADSLSGGIVVGVSGMFFALMGIGRACAVVKVDRGGITYWFLIPRRYSRSAVDLVAVNTLARSFPWPSLDRLVVRCGTRQSALGAFDQVHTRRGYERLVRDRKSIMKMLAEK